MSKLQRHVLIVDDSEDDRLMFSQHLGMKGYRVSGASDGREGLEMAFELHPDLIVMDMWLPKMSGWEVIRRLQADQEGRDIPVVVVTGHVVRPLGCDGWVEKPCRLEELDAEIEKIFKARKKVLEKVSRPAAAEPPPSPKIV